MRLNSTNVSLIRPITKDAGIIAITAFIKKFLPRKCLLFIFLNKKPTQDRGSKPLIPVSRYGGSRDPWMGSLCVIRL